MNYHILCIDETQLTGMELDEILNELDISITSVRNENEAEALLQDGARKFDILVRAINYAGPESYDRIRMLKKKSFCKHLPLVIVSEYADRGNILRAIEAGAVEYIAKPYDDETVCEKIGEILGINVVDSTRHCSKNDFIIYSWKEILSKELKSSSRGSYPVSILMASIIPQSMDSGQCEDPAELVNLMVMILKTKLRDTDTVFAYRYNSFVALLPFADRDGAETVRKRIESLFKEHAMIRHKSEGCSLFTATVTCPDNGRVKEKLMHMLEKKISDQIGVAGLQAAVHI